MTLTIVDIGNIIKAIIIIICFVRVYKKSKEVEKLIKK